MASQANEPWRKCSDCGGEFAEKRTYTRHLKSDKHRKAVGQPVLREGVCEECGERFNRVHDVERHKRDGRCRPARLQEYTRAVPSKRAFHETSPSGEEQPARKPYVQESGAASDHEILRTLEDLDGLVPFERPHLPPRMDQDGHASLVPAAPSRTNDLLTVPDASKSSNEQAHNVFGGGLSDALEDLYWTDDLPRYDLMDLDALPGDLEAISSSLDSHSEGPPSKLSEIDFSAPSWSSQETGKVSSDSSSIRSTSSLLSLSQVIHRLRNEPAVLKRRRVPTKHPLASSAQRCGLCKRPFERDVEQLRQHLDTHVLELSAQSTLYSCDICQIDFVRREDLLHHARSAETSSCCALESGHGGPCTGHRCGFNFKHHSTCDGHHPPLDTRPGWSDHDRIKFGQMLRSWELVQISTAVAEAGNVQRVRHITSCLSDTSLPSRFLRRMSKASLGSSMFSWGSEPYRLPSDLARDLDDRLANLSLDNSGSLSASIRRRLRLGRLQAPIDEKLLGAVANDDLSSVLDVIRRGIRADEALPVAVERGKRDIVDVLLTATTKMPAESLYKAVLYRHVDIAEALLKHRNCASLTQAHGAVLLQLAIRSGISPMVSMLLQYGVNPNQGPSEQTVLDLKTVVREPSDGDQPRSDLSVQGKSLACTLSSDTPMYVAASLGEADMVMNLLARNADADAAGCHGTALGAALVSGNIQCLEALLTSKSHIRYERCWQGQDAFQVALSWPIDGSLLMLLQHCATVDDGRCDHASDALLVASKERCVELLHLARICGADSHTRDGTRSTALHLAAQAQLLDVGDYEATSMIVEALIEAEAEVDPQDFLGNTPLFYAVRSNNTRVARALITAGATVDRYVLSAAINDDGARPIDTVVARTSPTEDINTESECTDRRSRSDVSLSTERLEVIRLLLASDVVTGHRTDALCAAASLRSENMALEAVEIVTRYGGADINGSDSVGRTALSCAAARGHISLIQCLLDLGALTTHEALLNAPHLESGSCPPVTSDLGEDYANVNGSCHYSRRTALTLAVASGSLGAVNLLLQANAPVGYDALEAAIQSRGEDAAVELLRCLMRYLNRYPICRCLPHKLYEQAVVQGYNDALVLLAETDEQLSGCPLSDLREWPLTGMAPRDVKSLIYLAISRDSNMGPAEVAKTMLTLLPCTDEAVPLYLLEQLLDFVLPGLVPDDEGCLRFFEQVLLNQNKSLRLDTRVLGKVFAKYDAGIPKHVRCVATLLRIPFELSQDTVSSGFRWLRRSVNTSHPRGGGEACAIVSIALIVASLLIRGPCRLELPSARLKALKRWCFVEGQGTSKESLEALQALLDLLSTYESCQWRSDEFFQEIRELFQQALETLNDFCGSAM